jgi:hypothetical protein
MFLLCEMAAISETSMRRSLMETVEKLKPGSFMNHDSAPTAYLALSIKEFLNKYSISLVYHPPYSPDLEPSLLFFYVSQIGKVQRFQWMPEITQSAMWELNNNLKEY